MFRIFVVIFCLCFFYGYPQSYRKYWTDISWARTYSLDDSIVHNEDSVLHYLYKAYKILPDKGIMLKQKPFTYEFLVEKHATRKEYEKVKIYLSEMSHWEPRDSTLRFVKERCLSCDSIARNFDAFYPATCTYKPLQKVADTHEYDSIINATFYHDQYIRRTRSLTRNTVFKINKQNLDNFEYCMRKYGYVLSYTPIDTTGTTVADILDLFIIHTDNWQRFKKIRPALLKANRAYKMGPSNFMYGCDRSRVNSGLRPLYFAFDSWNENYAKYRPLPEEVKRANKERAKIGALPLGVSNK